MNYETDAVMEELKKRLGIPHVSDEQACLVCHSKNSNWLIVLQDILEDNGADVQLFCDSIPGWFVSARGRLRLKFSRQCTNLARIRQQYNAIEKKS